MLGIVEPDLLLDYLRHIGIDQPGEPSAENLRSLQAAHLDNLAYSNLDLLLGQPEGLEPRACLHHIVGKGRSSGCCQHNGAFAAILQALGYRIRLLPGTVSDEIGQLGSPLGNHMAIVVTTDGEDWLADVGLGDAFRAPLILQPGVIDQYPFRYELLQINGEWIFRHDPRCSFAEVVIGSEAVSPEDFAPQYNYYISDPASPFLKTLAVHRRGKDFVYTLRGRLLRRIDQAGVSDVILRTEDELWETMTKVFKIPLGDVRVGDRRRIWQQTLDTRATKEIATSADRHGHE